MNIDKLKSAKNRKELFSQNELDALFESLQPILTDEMIGDWTVDYLLTKGTGSKFETFLKYLPACFYLYGKKFIDKNHVKAWIFRFFGLKFGILGTSAILRSIEFRGKLSASMVYNYLPMIDNFRKLDDSTVMGIMEIKGKISTYFYLTKE